MLEATKAAAILGVLRRDSPQSTALGAANSSIQKYTWTLLRLMILIGLTFIPMLVLISIVVRVLGANKYAVVFALGFYLVLIKYALAYPLVVIENLKARDALWQSWEMTKGHFGYVLGCYLFLGLSQWLIRWTISSPINGSDSGLSWAWILVQFCLMLIESLWIVLSWCMYLRIKEVDSIAPPQAVAAT